MTWESIPYDVSHFVLCGEYIVLCLLAVLAVLRLQLKANLKHSWQGRFFFLLFAGCIARALFFALQPFLMEDDISIPNKWNLALNDFPSLLFLTAYHIILYHFAKIYHVRQARRTQGLSVSTTYKGSGGCSITQVQLQVTFVFASVFMWGSVLILLTLDLIFTESTYSPISMDANPLETTTMFLIAIFYFFSSIAFLVYGGLVYRQFRAIVPTVTDKRQAIAIRLRVIMFLVPLCFMSRVPFIIWNMIDSDLTLYWWWDLFYFTVLELVPLFLLLTVLRLDSKRDREDYIQNSTPRPISYSSLK